MFKKINQLLPKQLHQKNLHNLAQAAYVCHLADQLAKGRYNAISFKNGVLTLGVKNNFEAIALQSEQMLIILEINKKLGQDSIKRLKYRIKYVSDSNQYLEGRL